jgi:hypothetical protein
MATPTCPNGADATVQDVYNSSMALTGGVSNPDQDIQTSMGIGLLNAPSTILKRKFRFLFGIQYCQSGSANTNNVVSPSFVKSANRPDITIQDTELNFLNQTTWIPGKAKWETIEVTYWDVAGAQNAGLFSWLASVYNFTSVCRFQSTALADYGGIATIVMLDGCGNPLESWILNDAWPSSIKFGELSYESSDVAEVTLTLRYSDVQYNSFCGGNINPCGCVTTCSSTATPNPSTT